MNLLPNRLTKGSRLVEIRLEGGLLFVVHCGDLNGRSDESILVREVLPDETINSHAIRISRGTAAAAFNRRIKELVGMN